MQKRYLPIILLTFVNIIGFTLLIPVLPTIVGQYAPAEWTGLFYGTLITSYALYVAINVQIFYLYALLLLAPSALYYWQKGHLLTVFEKI